MGGGKRCCGVGRSYNCRFPSRKSCLSKANWMPRDSLLVNGAEF